MKTLLLIINIIIFFDIYSAENISKKDSKEIPLEYLEELNPISIIKTLRGQEPIAYTINNDKSKICFLENKKDDINENLFFTVLAKINNSWIEFNRYSISDGYDIVRPRKDSIQHIEIENNTYMFFATECYNTGTYYYGLHTNTFVYYDDLRDSLLEVTYSIWSSDAMGNYSIGNSSLKIILHSLNMQLNKLKIFMENRI